MRGDELPEVKPPQLGQWLMRHCLPRGPKGASIAGDLHEDFALRAGATRFWYLKEAARLSLQYLASRCWERLQGSDDRRKSRKGNSKTMLKDIGLSLRSLAGNPGYTAICVATVALGIGANALMFSVVNGVLLKPLPYARPLELVRAWPNDQLSQEVVSALDEKASSFQAVSGRTPMRLALTGHGDPEEIQGGAVSTAHFSLLGAQPAVGRLFNSQDAEPGAEPAVILAFGFWQRRFGADPGIVGSRITLGDRPVTVVGVMPAEFRPLNPDWEFWAPLVIDPASPVYVGRTWLRVIGRLKPGVSTEEATAELQHVAAGIVRARPEIYSDNWVRRATAIPLHKSIVGNIEAILWSLLGAVGFVFLIACVNLSSLLLARGESRRKEVAIRMALGARRAQVARRFLIESGLLGLLGGAVGLGAAAWALLAIAGHYPSQFPLAERIGIDLRVCAYALAFSLLAGLAFGAWPAWRSTGSYARGVLGAGRGDAQGGIANRRWTATLVTCEVALAVVLVIGAGLMAKSFWNLSRVDPGLEVSQTVAMRLNPPWQRYSDAQRISDFYNRVVESVEALPGVARAGAIHNLPLKGGRFNFTYFAQDQAIPEGGLKPSASVRLVVPGYFRSLGIALLEGRTLARSDGSQSPAVGMINESMAQHLWPSESALGKEIRFFGPQEPPFTIVGVVADVRQYGLRLGPVPEIYRPLSQYPWDSLYLTASVEGDPLQAASAIRSAVWSVDKDVAVSQISSMAQAAESSISDSRFFMLLLSAAGMLAICLGSLGVYGVSSFAVNRRLHEIGVRMALGAAKGRVLQTVLASGMKPVAVGIAIGAAAALALTRVLTESLFEVSPLDPWVFCAVSLLLILIAALSNFIPARRATRVEPVAVLRNL